ncbi:hypothetical protein [Rhizobium sp. SL42]|uniref:hypothetical protein n=1 Tax=Rhizobium sp. SL42 TaxID=2806346 RepID=UPI001F3F8F3D|nr:hypothetical protein [Rhizobium sp. SL42]UJW73837.1 hypothetical protein IM739_13160 [Rhizobium sp. SL42]
MSEFRLSFPACAIAGKQTLSLSDIRLLRIHMFAGGVQTSADVTTPAAPDNCGRDRRAEWISFFFTDLEAAADGLSNDPQWHGLADHLPPCRAKSTPQSPTSADVRWLKVPDHFFLEQGNAA